jgi:hypothetical protein
MEISVNIHYANFLEDVRDYEIVTSFWTQQLEQLPSVGEWHPFYQNPARDGNPVFSAWLPGQRKLLRIIQFLPEPGDTLCSAWLDDWQGDWPEGLSAPADLDEQPVPELVIELAATNETLQLVRTLIYLWLVADISVAEMKVLLEE